MHLNILSVAEAGGDSDVVVCIQGGTDFVGRYNDTDLKISINSQSQITIEILRRTMNQRIVDNKLTFNNLDIDGMIEYLTEVKQFISEAKLVDRLMGKR